jgi:hypothetical protein
MLDPSLLAGRAVESHKPDGRSISQAVSGRWDAAFAVNRATGSKADRQSVLIASLRGKNGGSPAAWLLQGVS